MKDTSDSFESVNQRTIDLGAGNVSNLYFSPQQKVVAEWKRTKLGENVEILKQTLLRHRACVDLLPENILFDIIYEIFER